MHEAEAGSTQFGSLLYQFRVRLGLSQAKVAAIAGLSAGYYSEVENSKRKPPRESTALRLASALDLNAREIEQLLVSAEAERSVFADTGELRQDVVLLISSIRRGATRLSPELVSAMLAAVEEAGVLNPVDRPPFEGLSSGS